MQLCAVSTRPGLWNEFFNIGGVSAFPETALGAELAARRSGGGPKDPRNGRAPLKRKYRASACHHGVSAW